MCYLHIVAITIRSIHRRKKLMPKVFFPLNYVRRKKRFKVPKLKDGVKVERILNVG